MPIVKKKLSKNFTQIPNAAITDERLSDAALRIMLYLLSKDKTWSPHVSDMMKQLKYSRSKVYAALGELIDAGYLERGNERKGGRFSASVYTLHNVPVTASVKPSHGDVSTDTVYGETSHGEGEPESNLPYTVTPDTVNRHVNNIRVSTNTDDQEKGKKKESPARAQSLETDERETDLPFAIRSRIKLYTNYQRHEKALTAEIKRLGIKKAVEILEARCFERADVRDWSYMVTTLRNEPPLSEDFAAMIGAAASSPVKCEEVVFSAAKVEAPKQPPAPDCDPQHASAWETAFNQLELQLDQGSFNSLLLDAHLVAVEHGEEPTFVVRARSPHAARTLQHRLYRNVHRILSDVLCAPVALRFVAPEVVEIEGAS